VESLGTTTAIKAIEDVEELGLGVERENFLLMFPKYPTFGYVSRILVVNGGCCSTV
jgi:hypothetical protein